jgi:hypothetical protein
MAGTDLVFFGRPNDIDTATSIYENFEQNIDPNHFYCMEVWLRLFWKSSGLVPYLIQFRHGLEFDVLKAATAPATKPHWKNRRNISRKILKALLSLLPYFLSHRAIKKLKSKIKADK